MASTQMMHQIGALDAAPTKRPHQKHAEPELSEVLGKCIMEKNICDILFEQKSIYPELRKACVLI